jgi:hypothetical protein
MKQMSDDSAAEQAAHEAGGVHTLDSWAWIARARAAARRAVDPSTPAAEAPGDSEAEAPRSPAD